MTPLPIPTRRWWDTDYPVIAKLDDRWDLIAHPNGPALCDGDTLSSIDTHPDDQRDTMLVKMKAQTAWREYAWPKLKPNFHTTDSPGGDDPAPWKPDYTKTPRRVVCAANRHRTTGFIICGARHWDMVMRAQNPYTSPADYDQGFIDQFGDWMTREEAWTVAVNQNQVRRRCGGDGERLFSENLY